MIKWSEKDIKISNYIKSASSFALPIILGWVLGAEYIALWFFVRSTSQLLQAYLPNPIVCLFYVKNLSIINLRGELFRGVIFQLLITCLSSIFLYFFIGNVFTSQELLDNHFILVLYAGFFCFSNFLNSILSYFRMSNMLVFISILDMLLMLLMLLLLWLVEDWYLFILIGILKEAVKSLLIYSLLIASSKNQSGRQMLRWKFIRLTIFKNLFRQPLKTLYQSLDRMYFPVLFGVAFAGETAFGASFAMIFAIMSSSAITWATPLLRSGGVGVAFALHKWFRLLIYVLLVSFALLMLQNFFESFLHEREIAISYETILGFLFASTSSINALSLAISKDRLISHKWVIVFYGQIAIGMLFLLILSFLLQVRAGDALLAGVFYNIFSFLIINSKDIKVVFKSGY